MVLSMEKEKWEHGNGEQAIILLYKDYMERMSRRTIKMRTRAMDGTDEWAPSGREWDK